MIIKTKADKFCFLCRKATKNVSYYFTAFVFKI